MLERVGDEAGAFDLWSTFTAAAEVAFSAGANGVSWFMVLAGLSLTYVALRRGETPGMLAFYSRRIGRLLRAYWAGFAISVGFLVLLAIPKTLIDGGDFLDQATRVGVISYYDQDSFWAGLTLVPRALRLEWFFILPGSLWFVVLLIQYYLLFPVLFRLLRAIGGPSLILLSLIVSLSASYYLWHTEGFAFEFWRVHAWAPFRLPEFVMGMALGSVVASPERVREIVAGPARTTLVVGVGVTLYLAGFYLSAASGFSRALGLPLIGAGLAAVSVPVVVKIPGRLEASYIGRLLAWIGPMSLAVLIMNEPLRFIDHYFLAKGAYWTSTWWFFVVAVYVPATVVLAVPLSSALGLTPPGHTLRLRR